MKVFCKYCDRRNDDGSCHLQCIHTTAYQEDISLFEEKEFTTVAMIKNCETCITNNTKYNDDECNYFCNSHSRWKIHPVLKYFQEHIKNLSTIEIDCPECKGTGMEKYHGCYDDCGFFVLKDFSHCGNGDFGRCPTNICDTCLEVGKIKVIKYS